METISLTDKAIESLRDELPAVFSRKAVADLLPGVISPRYLANMAGEGEGPDFFRLGRRVCYERDSFLEWLKSRAGE